jgi:NADH:ubiquinone oxidoreductase subunit 3 (subunit A)
MGGSTCLLQERSDQIYLVFFLGSLLIPLLLSFISFELISQKPSFEKSSSYECGFLPFEDARSRFDIKFYLVAIFFVIFDLEIAFLFPWVICRIFLGGFGMFLAYFFLILLTLSYLLEWYRGLLDF